MTRRVYKYDNREKASQPKMSVKMIVWNGVVKELEQGLKCGKVYWWSS